MKQIMVCFVRQKGSSDLPNKAMAFFFFSLSVVLPASFLFVLLLLVTEGGGVRLSHTLPRTKKKQIQPAEPVHSFHSSTLSPHHWLALFCARVFSTVYTVFTGRTSTMRHTLDNNNHVYLQIHMEILRESIWKLNDWIYIFTDLLPQQCVIGMSYLLIRTYS